MFCLFRHNHCPISSHDPKGVPLVSSHLFGYPEYLCRVSSIVQSPKEVIKSPYYCISFSGSAFGCQVCLFVTSPLPLHFIVSFLCSFILIIPPPGHTVPWWSPCPSKCRISYSVGCFFWTLYSIPTLFSTATYFSITALNFCQLPAFPLIWDT